MEYEKLLKKYSDELIINETELNDLKGIYANTSAGSVILIDKNLTQTEKRCVLAEEVGHHYTAVGDVTNQNNITNIKLENNGRAWAYEELVPLISILRGYLAHCSCRFELAEYLNVTEEFLLEAIEYYKRKLGLFYRIDNYTIIFEPLGVYERF